MDACGSQATNYVPGAALLPPSLRRPPELFRCILRNKGNKLHNLHKHADMKSAWAYKKQHYKKVLPSGLWLGDVVFQQKQHL